MLSRKYPRLGYRKLTRLLRREGWQAGRKLVQRIRRECDLRVKRWRKRPRRRGCSTGTIPTRAERVNHVWSWDFISDRTDNGGKLRILSVIDEYSRECLALHVARKLTADDLVEVMERLVIQRGVPAHTPTPPSGCWPRRCGSRSFWCNTRTPAPVTRTVGARACASSPTTPSKRRPYAFWSTNARALRQNSRLWPKRSAAPCGPPPKSTTFRPASGMLRRIAPRVCHELISARHFATLICETSFWHSCTARTAFFAPRERPRVRYWRFSDET